MWIRVNELKISNEVNRKPQTINFTYSPKMKLTFDVNMTLKLCKMNNPFEHCPFQTRRHE